MRVILLSDPDFPDPEGTFQPAHRLGIELRHRGCAVVHTTPLESGRPSVERMDRVPVRRLAVRSPSEGAMARASFPIGARVALYQWLGELRERRPDIIHAHLSPSAVWFAAHAARALRVPWVLTALGSAADRILGGSGAAGTAKRLRTCAGAASPSERALQKLGGLLPPAVPRAMIPAGADPAAVEDTPPADPSVLGMGRLEASRGFDTLLRAFAAVRKRIPQAVLTIAGDGPDRRRLARIEKTLPEGIRPAIRWEGSPGPARAAELIRGARIVVLPGSSAGYEITAIQAMAAGRPVVLTRSDDVPVRAVDGGNALVVPPGDAGTLAESLLGLLEDGELAIRLAHAGRGQAMRNSAWGSVADRYLDLLRTVTRNGSRG